MGVRCQQTYCFERPGVINLPFSERRIIIILVTVLTAVNVLSMAGNLTLLLAGGIAPGPPVVRYVLWFYLALLFLLPVVITFLVWRYWWREGQTPPSGGSSGERNCALSFNREIKELVMGVREIAAVIRSLMDHLSQEKEKREELVGVLQEMVASMKEFTGWLETGREVSVAGEVFRAERRPGEAAAEDGSGPDQWSDFPKGLNRATLKQILSYLEDHNETGVSAEEIAGGVGLSRVTVRRYMDYLEQVGYVSVDLRYGTVGRPLKIYTLVNLFSG
ncbi:HTH domain-containing protein [Desulfofundulus thermobenzoicus]|uniref:HTH domain-containing protein n=1 Tax=Desulfofundulus thermobenzoicus TaxID=29376 RepID=A0A6N7IMY6_9FIRM|nr:HTH domain-containing protein [Desulfofundulus thermobenzoicus]